MTPATRRMLIGVQLCFGVFPWLGKVAMEAFEPRAVLVWRLFVGTAVLLFLAFRLYGRVALPAPRDLARLFGLSLLGVTINQSLFLEGLARSTAVNAGLLMTVIPVATVALSALVGQERATRRQVGGIALSVAGVAWLFVDRGAHLGADTLVGDLLMTGNALSYSAYLVFARPVAARLPQPVVIAWVFVFGALTAPLLAWDVPWWPMELETRHILALGGVLLFPTILAYLGNMVVLGRVGANVTAAYVMLQPVLGAAMGIGLLGERPNPSLLITAAGVLSGLWFVSTKGRGAVAVAATDQRRNSSEPPG
jgi:drug/metabolite transporter (DMT)-like permease